MIEECARARFNFFSQPGTYFYHGHFGSQRAAGFYGALIVDLPPGKHEPYTYDGEHMIILNDWWHRPIIDQEEGLDLTNFKWVGEPQVMQYNVDLDRSNLVEESNNIYRACD